MKIIYKTLTILAATMLFVTCQRDRGGSITGVVVDRVTGDPIPIANVRLFPGEESRSTNNVGFFQFENLASGVYTLFVSSAGYRDDTIERIIVAGNSVERNIAMERLPAIVTVDRTTLDFGSEAGITQLSFSLVNSSGEDLEWWIATTTPWIVSINPNNGVIQHGRTQSVQVTIDRNMLNYDNNTTVLNIISDNGRSEITLNAYRPDTQIRVLTRQPNSLGSTTAHISVEISTADGSPFSERVPTDVWLLISTNSDPTSGGERWNLEIPADAGSRQSISPWTMVSGLTPGTVFHMQAFATNGIGTRSGGIVSFTTTGTPPQ